MPYTIKSDGDTFTLFEVDQRNNVKMIGSGPDRDDLLVKTEKSDEKCGCEDDCDCEDCNGVFRSVSYAKYVNTTKCGCGNNGALITIDDLRGRKKKTKKGG